MTNTRTLKSRNQREGWYCGRNWTGKRKDKRHTRNPIYGLRHKAMI